MLVLRIAYRVLRIAYCVSRIAYLISRGTLSIVHSSLVNWLIGSWFIG